MANLVCFTNQGKKLCFDADSVLKVVESPGDNTCQVTFKDKSETWVDGNIDFVAARINKGSEVQRQLHNIS